MWIRKNFSTYTTASVNCRGSIATLVPRINYLNQLIMKVVSTTSTVGINSLNSVERVRNYKVIVFGKIFAIDGL